MISFLQDGYRHFMRDPLGEVLAAALFLLAAITGLFTGVGALMYLLHLAPKEGCDPITLQLQMMQRFRGTRRVSSAFWLGLLLWLIVVLPNLQNPIFGVPAAWLILQPVWLSLLMADRYDLTLPIALKATYHFTMLSPAAAIQLYLLGLLAFAGLFCFGIGIFITLPIALYAILRMMESVDRDLSIAVQRAY
ncbi:MAG: hypothetical protein IKM62_02745 [Kiritimatiellae bacterium]|nr:hypothetical protein [Kiritimatiellia bacterium]